MHIYVEAIAGIITDWLQKTVKLEKNTLVKDLTRLIDVSLPAAITAGRRVNFV